MRSARLLTLAGCLLLAAAGALRADQFMPWAASLPEATARAGRERKLVLIHFWADGCSPCQQMESYVFSRKDVVDSLAANYVPVKVNATKQPDLARRYGVSAWPTDVVLTPEGRKLAQLTGAQEALHYQSLLAQFAARYKLLFPEGPFDEDESMAASGDEHPFQQAQFTGQPPSGGYSGGAGNGYTQNAAAGPYGQNSAGAYGQNSVYGPPNQAVPYGQNLPANGQNGPAQGPYNGQLQGQYGQGPYNRGQNGQGQYGQGQYGQRPPATAAGQYGQPQGQHPGQYGAGPSGQYPPAGPPGGVAQVWPPGEPNRNGNPGAAGQAGPGYGPQGGGSQAGGPASSSSQLINNPFHDGGGTQQSQAETAANQQQQPSSQRAAAQQAAAPPSHPPIALDGFCPVTVVRDERWAKGDPRYGVIHRGRTYLFTGPQEQQMFLAAPDRYSPVLSGYDPVRFLETGEFVEGKRSFGVFFTQESPTGTLGQMYLFADEASREKFEKASHEYSIRIRQAMSRAAGGVQR